MSSWGPHHRKAWLPLTEPAIHGRHRHGLKEVMFALIKMPPQAREVDQHSLGQTPRLPFFLYHHNFPRQLAPGTSCAKNPAIWQEGMFLFLQPHPFPSLWFLPQKLHTLSCSPYECACNQCLNKERNEQKRPVGRKWKIQIAFSPTPLSFIRDC